MNVNKIISKINDMNLQSEEDLQEVESVLTEMDNALIEPLFRLLERHPHFNFGDRKSTRLNSSHTDSSRMPSSA